MTTTTLVARVTRRAVGWLLATLILAGAGTALLLHLQALRALDQALLAAAFGEAHPWSDERWTNEHRHAPAEVQRWAPGGGPVSDAVARDTLAQGVPRYRTVGDDRVLLFPVSQTEGAPATQLVVVTAPRVTPWRSIGPFLLSWAVMSALVGTVVTVVLERSIRHAAAPLQQAAADLTALPGWRPGVRLAGGGVAEVDEVIASVNGLLAMLETAYRQQQRFTAEAAHELRTPVTVLRGEVELALRRPRDAEAYREALSQVGREAERLGARVEALMALARVDAGSVEAGRSREHLSAIVHEALAQEQETVRRAGAAVQVSLVDDPMVDVHGPLMAVALGNLLRNAALHGGGGPIEVRAAETDGIAEVLVDDEGPGVPAQERATVFDRFHARRGGEHEGLGLGLPLAREVARRHGGDVTLHDAPGGGCRARLVLPVAS